jgi:hypothetical protein
MEVELSVCKQAMRVRKRLAKTRPPKGQSSKAKEATAALRARMAQKKK